MLIGGKKMRKKDELLSIINGKKIYPVFQPIVSLRDGKILGYEALSRIEGKSSIQSVEEFFVLGVMYGKTWEIEKLCRKKILQAYADFPEAAKKGKLFINVNPLVMRDEKFKQSYTKKLLEKCGVNTNRIVIEVTERNTIENMEEFNETVNHYKQQGYEIAIDDMGAGYSGLNVVANTYPRYVKIDMALIQGIDKDPMRQALVKGLVEMSNHTAFDLVAEGIETEEELNILMRLGVSYGQGFLLGKPYKKLMPIKRSVEKLILEGSNNELKKDTWCGRKYMMLQATVSAYSSIDAYSEKYGEESLSEALHIFFEIVRKSLNVFEGMYILDENSCVIILQNDRYGSVREQITQQFNDELARIYSDKDLNNGYIEVKNSKGEPKKRPLMSVTVEML